MTIATAHRRLLRGDRAGQHGIRINAEWRIRFRRTDDGPPCEVWRSWTITERHVR